MATRTSLRTKYGAYYRRDIPKEDAELTHVGPGTPCGEYFRRYWNPVVLSRELTDLPIRVRVLDEDLVVFRDYSGRVGVLGLFCSHRGTSLEFGQIRQRGIQCCYHGWLYDVDGTILDTPGEPASSTIKDEICHPAYPALEYKGLVYAYMGPPEVMPPFPEYDFWSFPEFPTVIYERDLLPCNWLQIKENAMDPMHLYFLHTTITGPQFTVDLEKVPEHLFLESPLGMVYVDVRRMDGDEVWVRMADFITPIIHQFPAGESVRLEGRNFQRPRITRWAVPVDNKHTITIRARRFREGEQLPEDYNDFSEMQAGRREYEERQRKPGDFEARVSIYGGLAIHDREYLGTSDRGVVTLRNVARQGIRAVKKGEDPKGVIREGAEMIPTYAHQRLVRVPPAATQGEDKQLLRSVGRQVAEEVFKDPFALHHLAAES